MNRRERTLLGVILLAAFALRLGLVVFVSQYPARYIRGDAADYNQIAVNVAAGHGFSTAATPPFLPDNARAPLYPLSIAAGYRLFGYAPAGMLFLQTVLAVLTIAVVARMSTITFGPQAGLLAAALLALSPISILYTALLWADTAFTLFLALAVLLAVALTLQPTLRSAIVAGAVAGLATLTHARSLYLPMLFVIVWVWMTWRRRESLRFAARWIGAYLLVYGLVLTPWITRNHRAFGVANFTSVAGSNLLNYGAALTEEARTGEDQWSIARRYRREILQSQAIPLNEATFSAIASRVAMKKIAEHPFLFARVVAAGMTKILFPSSFTAAALFTGREPESGTKNIYGLFGARRVRTSDPAVQDVLQFPPQLWVYIGFESVYLACIYLLSVCAVFSWRRSKPWTPFLTSIVLYLSVVAAAGGSPRFRVAMMPFLTMLAASGYLQLRRAW